MIQKLSPRRRKDPLKTLTTQLRKQGLAMVPGPVIDPDFGHVYTFQAIKRGTMSNSDVAGRLFYAGEVAKWSVSRRKAVSKAAVKAQAKAKVEGKRTASEGSKASEKENSSSSSSSRSGSSSQESGSE